MESMVAEMPVAEVAEAMVGAPEAWDLESEWQDPELQEILLQQLADMSDAGGDSDRATPSELWFGGAI